ncbi:hypothetical protein EIN_139090, partial [Entamoeba invadens IP1]
MNEYTPLFQDKLEVKYVPDSKNESLHTLTVVWSPSDIPLSKICISLYVHRRKDDYNYYQSFVVSPTQTTYEFKYLISGLYDIRVCEYK